MIYSLAKLPEAYSLVKSIVDVLPIVPVFFLLLAFVWQASVSFRLIIYYKKIFFLMRRVKREINAQIRRQKILLLRKRAIESNSRSFRIAKQQLIKSINFSYCSQQNRKRYFRSLWIIRLNRALKTCTISDRNIIFKNRLIEKDTFFFSDKCNYLTFIYSIRQRKCILNRKVMAQIVLLDPPFFYKLVDEALFIL
uniref:Photosystem II reaction center protein K n=15 Tax=Eukaryota TaxID=2759 RepID=A0A0F7R644_LEPCH|nr:fusion protein of photosystem II protein K and ribosomal protein L20 [Lepidodinium chlorophorum]BAR72347.1 fusion protein of photosystem II protein K and ribosomal protein L20 [Lepidodinium chlorophorum]